MSDGTIYIDCPCCGARLEVERKNGKVIEVWSKKDPAQAKETDPLKAAAQRMKQEKAKRENFLANAKEIIEERKRKALEKFEAEKERIHREGDFSRPDNPMDLD